MLSKIMPHPSEACDHAYSRCVEAKGIFQKSDREKIPGDVIYRVCGSFFLGLTYRAILGPIQNSSPALLNKYTGISAAIV